MAFRVTKECLGVCLSFSAFTDPDKVVSVPNTHNSFSREARRDQETMDGILLALSKGMEKIEEEVKFSCRKGNDFC